jgi:glycine hydroxymethyltransferase
MDDLAERVSSAVFPGLTANFDLGRLPSLHAAATELLRNGHRYGELCLTAAKALAEGLVELGLPVMAAARGYTGTNQVLVRMPDRPAADAAVLRFNEIGIYLSATEHVDELGPSSALRLGTQELVRRGFGTESMAELASLLAATLYELRSSAELRGAVEALLRRALSDPTVATPAPELR